MTASKNKKGQRGNFFAVEKRCFEKARELGLNEGLAYLVLACFSGPDNLTTSASVNAVEKYAGISRSRASEALTSLVSARLIKKLRGGKKPKYEFYRYLETLSEYALGVYGLPNKQQAVIRAMLLNQSLDKTKEYEVDQLVKKGWLDADNHNFVIDKEEDLKHAYQQWIWLPNEVIKGTKKKEIPPIKLIRQVRDPLALQMFVDAYDSQNLAEFGGVDPVAFRGLYEREKVYSYGEYDIYAFSDAATSQINLEHAFVSKHLDHELTGSKTQADFFPRFKGLETLGLFEAIPYLFESDDPDAEPIHSLERSSSSSCCLRALSKSAALHLLPDNLSEKLLRQERKPFAIVPVKRHMRNITVKDVYRLRYRAKTKMTAMWWKKLKDNEKFFSEIYKSIKKR